MIPSPQPSRLGFKLRSTSSIPGVVPKGEGVNGTAVIQNTKLENPKPSIQIIVSRGPLYFTHSAIWVQNNDKIYFWDLSGSYGMDEDIELLYFKRVVKRESSAHQVIRNKYKKSHPIYRVAFSIAGTYFSLC